MHLGILPGASDEPIPKWIGKERATPQDAQMHAAHEVARLFARPGVTFAWRDRSGYPPCDRALVLAKIRSNAAHRSFWMCPIVEIKEIAAKQHKEVKEIS